jgi:hypothetical protein
MKKTKAKRAAAPQAEWVWMPHAAHFICGSDCRFHLATYVNGYIVSTVGEYLPASQVREILAGSRGVILEGKGDAREADYMRKVGFEKIGCDRLYETMVFRAVADPGHACCPWRMEGGDDLDFRGYNDSGEARLGHIEFCVKWASVEAPAAPLSRGREGKGR